MGATIAGKEVGQVGYGMMGLSWRNPPLSDEQAIRVLKSAVDSGANLWNGGEFYGKPQSNSLTLLNKYFTLYPEDADKVVINIKGALGPDLVPDSSERNIRQSIDNCLNTLAGKKFIDVFECARVDPNHNIEDTIKILAGLVKEGKIGAIGLSEVKADTIYRAQKVHPIASVEVEVSLWAMDIFSNGVAKACAELDIPILAYSPLGRGMLTGKFKSPEDLPQGDWRRYLPRFMPGAFEKNIELVNAVGAIADKKGCTRAQLAIAWLKSLSGKDGNPIIIPIPGTGSETTLLENMTDIHLTPEEHSEIRSILAEHTVVGGRYDSAHAAFLEG